MYLNSLNYIYTLNFLLLRLLSKVSVSYVSKRIIHIVFNIHIRFRVITSAYMSALPTADMQLPPALNKHRLS